MSSLLSSKAFYRAKL